MPPENADADVAAQKTPKDPYNPFARDRAALLAAMPAGADEAEPRPAAKVEAKSEPEPKAIEPDEDDADTPAESELDAPDKKGDDDNEDDDEDSKDTKGLDKVKAFEKRVRAELAKDREDLKAEVAKIQRDIDGKLERVAKFEKLAERIKYDPAAVLKELGVTDEDLEGISKDLYAATPKMLADPKNKEAAQRAAKAREESDRVAKLEKEIADMKAEKTTAAKEAQMQAQIDAFIDDLAKGINDDYPLVQKLNGKNAQLVRRMISAAAQDIHSETGQAVTSKQVLRRIEKTQRERLEELDIDVSSYVKKADGKAKAETKADGKAKAETKPVAPTAKSRRESRDDLIKQLEANAKA